MSTVPTRTCSICAASMPGDSARCPACGHAVDRDEPARAAPLKLRCPICAAPLAGDAERCATCGRVFEPGERPVAYAPGATAAAIFGLLSLFCCGLIFGIVAIAQAGKAEQAIVRNPELQGAQLARTGMVLGIIAIVLNVFGAVYYLARSAGAEAVVPESSSGMGTAGEGGSG